MPTPEQSSVIDIIHDAAFNAGLWAEVIERLSDEMGADCGLISDLDIVTGMGSGIPVRQDAALMDDYRARWSDSNPLLIADDPIDYARSWRPAILRDGDWIDRDVLRATPYYNEFLRPIGAEQSIFIRLGFGGSVVSSISIARRETRGAFQSNEIDVARRYHPHLIQAFRTAQRLKINQEALDQFDILLEATDAALIFLGPDLRVQRMTAAAEQSIFRPGCVRMIDGRLELPDARQDAQLQEILGSVGRGAVSLSPLVVHSPSGASKLELHVTQLGPRSMAFQPGTRFVLVSAKRLDVQPLTSSAFDWGTRYRLTPAETRVASAIAEGLSLREAAERLGVSIHTVRAQLSTIFGKTGTHRQADLVRLPLSAETRER